MSKASQFIILCEDRLHEVFVRRFLKKCCGTQSRVINCIPLPAGNGCGEQHVRARYPNEVRAYRGRQSKAVTVLIVVIDADNETVENRQLQLDSAAKSAGLPPRDISELIVYLIPKRHIETWLAFFDNSDDVNETEKYKPQYSFHKRESEAHLLIDKFTEMFRQHQQPSNSLPSLVQAFDELKRLPKIL